MTSEPADERLTDEDREVLARMKREVAEAKKQPDWNSVPITNPDKFAGPIGADADGNIVTYRSIEDVPPRAELVIEDDQDDQDERGR